MATTRTAGSAGNRAGLVRPGLTRLELPSIELDPRTAYDFLIAVCVDCGELDDVLPEDRKWRETVREATKQNGCMGFTQEFGRLLLQHSEIRTARQIVDALDKLTDAEFLEVMMGELLEDAEVGPITRRAIDGDEGAYDELAAKMESMKGEPMPFSDIPSAPGIIRAELRKWLPGYEAIEPRIARMLEKDVAARHLDEMASDPIGFVERTTNGIRLGMDRVIKRVVLAPTYFGRPYNALTKLGTTQVIIYPIADSSMGSASRTTPPIGTLRLYRALGDETRLRILRLLAEQDRYLTELANELDLRKPTVSHHLAQLRSAGLVTVTEQGNLTYYSLRRDRIREAGPELASFLAQ